MDDKFVFMENGVLTTNVVQVHDDDSGSSRYINQYIIQKKIGSGAFGVVHLVVDSKTQKQFAMKEVNKRRIQRKNTFSMGRLPPKAGGLRIPPSAAAAAAQQQSEDPWDMIKREIAIMKKLKHKHVIQLYEVLDADDSDCLYLVMECAELGAVMDIDQKIQKPLQLDLAWRIFRELTLGVEYLHYQGIAHRDLKPDNLLLLADGTLKIVDFGVSEMFLGGNDTIRKSAGSPAFMSPEMCTSKDKDQKFSAFKADIWSMGVVLYCMLFGKVPFFGENPFNTYEAIRNETPQLPQNTDHALTNLFHGLLEKDPNHRITLTQIKEHPWVTKNGQCPLPSTIDNCGSTVVSVTEDDMKNSITKIRSVAGIVTVMKAVNKFRSRSHSTSE